jgi:2-polyprenyl-3-methyl-5-hydroxy-6-metoxy-1,4-benzoquinol methylase
MCITTILVYVLVTRLFLFKTEWIIKILKLDKQFIEERIELEVPAQTVLAITISIIGAIWFLKSFPSLATSIFNFLKQKELIKNYLETGWLIYYSFSTIIGFLIMTNGKSISNYIWKENEKNL